MYDRITPGKEWLDSEGKRIEAHGGYICKEGDTYYWYSEIVSISSFLPVFCRSHLYAT